MGGKKIKLVKETITFILKELTEKDRFSLIVFNQESEVVFPLSYMTEQEKNNARKAIKRIRTGGATNLRTPLVQAVELLS